MRRQAGLGLAYPDLRAVALTAGTLLGVASMALLGLAPAGCATGSGSRGAGRAVERARAAQRTSDAAAGGTESARAARAERQLREAVGDLPAATRVTVAAFDLATGDSVLIDAHSPLHAASTMKVGVLIELFRQVDSGRRSLEDSVLVENRFRSIVDGSSYALDIADDSDSLVYERIGRRESLAWLAERMITHSSNLATNLLIQLVTPDSVNATLREIGAGEMRVLRGVEDAAAFRRGLNNTTTAYGLARALLAIARAERGETMPGLTRPGAERMAGILARQAFDQGIPAGLPAGTRVAHKTGWIEGIEHDGGIVYPPGRAPYVLVVLTSGFADSARANAEIARVAKGSWELWGEGR